MKLWRIKMRAGASHRQKKIRYGERQTVEQ